MQNLKPIDIHMLKKRIQPFLLTILFVSFWTDALIAQKQFTFEDVLKFEDIKTPVISADGNWVSYGVWPEIGDGETRIQSVKGDNQLIIKRGINPRLTPDGSWAGALVQPPYIEAQNAGNNGPRQGAVLLNTSTQDTLMFEEVRRFSFTNNGKWALIHHYQSKEAEDAISKSDKTGTPVTLANLESGSSRTFQFVHEAAVDSTSRYAAFSRVDTTGEENGIYLISLEQSSPEEQKVAGFENALYSNLTWDHKNERLAFTATEMDTTHNYLPSDATIWLFTVGGETEPLVTPEDTVDGFRLRANNSLMWTHDGMRLFYGVTKAEMVAMDELKDESDTLTAENLYDTDRILKDIEGKVWHWDDPLIKTHEKQTWNSRKNHLYRAVYHLDTGTSVQLADERVPNVTPVHHTGKALGSSDLPYQKLRTWDGTYRDYYLIDLETGEAELILEKQRFGASLSPGGTHAAWFDGNDWNIMNTESGISRNLTSHIETPLYDEENDRPMPSGSYGIAGWTDQDRDLLIYDKYDLWQLSTENEDSRKITDGRKENRIYRIRNLNPKNETYARNERLLLTMYHDKNKNYGFYEARLGRSGVSRVMEKEKQFNIVALAEYSDAILFTQETYQEYPNLWVVSDRRFRDAVQVSHLHEDLTETFAWGEAELIDWQNMDGDTVQGILIYPGDYDPDKRYPVFIYYYERYSQRLYEFNKPVTNHRPNLAQYASDGYAVFLPDIWFDIPIPGYSATKNLVPGVQKLVEMGVADPAAIGLHGHSWSGYLTAHVVTQTDIFAAAVAGAPVGNMTSAYSGIRWGTGLARQFQYEQTQSRLGVSMWENLSPYIENSPVFFADRINTPLMIQHGDADEAVPWYQSIELYLALRRNAKESVFLHYYDEPHHLRKMANRLDYAIKMKEYMDHYLKGFPAPAWITDGVPYQGN